MSVPENNSTTVKELFEKRFKVQEDTLTVIVNSLLNIKADAPEEVKIFWNIAGFINIASYDIKIICRDLLIAQNEWQKRHYARQACLIIYESIDVLFELFGKGFKTHTNSIQNPNFQSDARHFRSSLNLFKEKYYKQLRIIRNTSIAHRDKESLKQLASIIEIDWSSTLNFTIEFESIIQGLQAFLQKFMREIIKRPTNQGE